MQLLDGKDELLCDAPSCFHYDIKPDVAKYLFYDPDSVEVKLHVFTDGARTRHTCRTKRLAKHFQLP